MTTVEAAGAHGTRGGGASRRLARRARLALCAGLAAVAASGAEPLRLVVCAPGYPGSTAEAQPTLDAFAAAAGRAAGWSAGSLVATYHEEEAAGLAALASNDAALALVPLPFFLQHRESLALVPIAQAVALGGEAAEPWTLVAGRGRVGKGADLAGYELVSLAAGSPRFVRAALAEWGALPDSLTFRASGAALSALRKAASGAPVAVLLDREGAAALASLPFAGELDVVTRTPAWPVSVLATVQGRLPAARAASLVSGLTRLAGDSAGAAALAAMRLDRFVPADARAIAAAEAAFAGARP